MFAYRIRIALSSLVLTKNTCIVQQIKRIAKPIATNSISEPFHISSSAVSSIVKQADRQRSLEHHATLRYPSFFAARFITQNHNQSDQEFTHEQEIEKKRRRLLYNSRKRGWVETCLLVGGFTTQNIWKLTETELDQLDNLLQEADPDLFKWITGKEPLPEKHDNELTRKLMAYIVENRRVPPQRQGEGTPYRSSYHEHYEAPCEQLMPPKEQKQQ